MGFDKDDSRPVTITAHKQTTKVNIGVVAGVLIFFGLAAVALGWFWFHPYETSRDVRVKTTTETPAR